jgi:hypothetical protein
VILALRALGVGDLITGVPALRGLRAACYGEPLVLAAPAWLTPLIDLIGGVGRIRSGSTRSTRCAAGAGCSRTTASRATRPT